MSNSGVRRVCTDCGFIYSPDDWRGVALGDLPPTWECPGVEGHCGAEAEKFDYLEDEDDENDADTDTDTDEVGGSGEPRSDAPADAAGISSPRELDVERVDRAVADLARMHDEDELILRPDWQRDYVWSNKQASQLIESLFMRLPIPLIYLFQESDGSMTVVDGQQRLTALIQFIRNRHFDPTKSGDVRLSGLEELTQLNRKRFSDLSMAEQRFLKNQVLSTVQMSSDINPELKLDIFRRLNTGSVKLVPQELRNAAYRGRYNDTLKIMCSNRDFHSMLGYPHPHKRMEDVELVLRFCAWYQRGFESFRTKKLADFLDAEMRLGSTYTSRELQNIERKFKDAVRLSLSTFGTLAFRRYRFQPDKVTGIWEKTPNKALYDVVMYGFARYSMNQVMPHIEAIRESLFDLMASDAQFQDAIGGSTSDLARIRYRFTTWLSRLEAIIGDDPQARTFSREFKAKLFTDDRTCKLCNQEIFVIDDAHVHHVHEYWRGGKTIPQNAALTHRYCNLSHGGGAKD
jgi:hypothetical protein